ncbi:hypothetical protein HRI_004188200 [Hibiscus trionum]|uniref:Uncharacterized protein n=1 Tax=Hibiscus trionum TaxID=183268 RepID=A0A9W7J0D5_HIBTR|nr:hypothetical protein HRI_004188200 [Hibiscus trionum]
MKKMSSSFSMCFLPVVSDDVLMVGKRSKESDVKQVLSPAKNTMGSDDKDKDAAGNSFGRKNKLGRRSLSRFVNAVFFETSLKKKVRSKKLGQKLHRNYNGDRSEFKSESKRKKISHPTNNDAPCEDIDHSTSSISSKASSCLSKSSSSSSSLMTASGRSSSSLSRSSLMTASRRSSSSLSSSSLMPASGPCNSRPALSGKSGHGSNIAFCCLLLTSLLVLVIWGKVCAIFCTSTVLVFANRWIKLVKQGPSDDVAADVRRLPEIDSRLYRKKIIMEGLLERNHCRNVY